jgi:hypothetical protein
MTAKLLALPFALCCACGPAEVSGTVGVTAPIVDAPALAYVAPGVEVVADADMPVFFADNFYWYWDGGLWYRADRYGGPRVVARDVPSGLRGIREPRAYVRYHGSARMVQRPMRGAARSGGFSRGMHRR